MMPSTRPMKPSGLRPNGAAISAILAEATAAAGVPVTITLTVVDVNSACAVLPNYALCPGTETAPVEAPAEMPST